jgi:hypothetical protein
MSDNQNIIQFPNNINYKKAKYIKIRDEVESLLFNYAFNKKDLWAVSLAAGRFSAMNLQKIDGEEKAMDFFKNCVDTQKKSGAKILSDS